MVMLKGNKVRLRAIEPEDVDRIMEWENETSNWEVSGTMAPFSRDIIKRYVANSHHDIYSAGQLRLMIDEVETGETIGTVDIFEFDAFHQRAGLGILIADKARRNNGYASESIALVVDYSFQHLGLSQLFCNILADNAGSIRVFEKAGFQISGNRKKWIRSGSAFKDQLFLQLFKKQ